MKLSLPVLLGAAALLGTACSQGAVYEISLTGALTTETGMGITKTVAVKTSDVIGALLVSGSLPGLTAKEVLLAYDDVSDEIEAVKKSDFSKQTEVGDQGSNYAEYGFLDAAGKNSSVTTVIQTDFEIQPLNAATQQLAFCTVVRTTKEVKGKTSISGVITGGSASGGAKEFEFRGKYKTVKLLLK